MCFFTDKKNPWFYVDESSLNNMQIGVAIDASIEELNSYVKKYPEQFQYQPYHERYIVQNAQKVLNKRIDAFIFTNNTTIYELKKEKLDDKVRNAGCVSKADIFLAFTPVNHKKSHVSKAIMYFDNRMATLAKTGGINKILLSYDIQ